MKYAVSKKNIAIFLKKMLSGLRKGLYLHPLTRSIAYNSTKNVSHIANVSHLKALGTLAQLVEQRTENPCVPGSIPGGTTLKPDLLIGFFVLYNFRYCNCLTVVHCG